jgi:hypothetical protein
MLESSNETTAPRFVYESMVAFKSMIRVLKESSFNHQWPFIFRFTFDFISSQRVKDYIECLGRGAFDENEILESELSDFEKSDGEEDKDEDKHY